MHHDEITLRTENARSAREMAARLQSAVAEEGLRVTADGSTVTIGFASPVLALLCRGITGLVNALSTRPGGHGAGLPSRP